MQPLNWKNSDGDSDCRFKSEITNENTSSPIWRQVFLVKADMFWSTFDYHDYHLYTQVSVESDENGDAVVILMRIDDGYVYKLTQGMSYHGKSLSTIEIPGFAGLWERNDGE